MKSFDVCFDLPDTSVPPSPPGRPDEDYIVQLHREFDRYAPMGDPAAERDSKGRLRSGAVALLVTTDSGADMWLERGPDGRSCIHRDMADMGWRVAWSRPASDLGWG